MIKSDEFETKMEDYNKHAILGVKQPLVLECGVSLNNFPVYYQTYGSLSEKKDNAVLVCHALSGDQFLAGVNPTTGKVGWWNLVVGPDKVIDTNRYFVICTNILGGCMGTVGPKEVNSETGEIWGSNFPMITIQDMVKAQALLIDHLAIDKLFCVIGGSMGGMQVLEWAATYPERVLTAVPIAAAAQHSAQNIAFHEVGRQAIMADPNWCGGNYYASDIFPDRGLAIARMVAHITYLSEPSLQTKFGRRLQDRESITFGFDADFQVESYLRHQGSTFVDRFDANSYLYITRAMDYFDLSERFDGGLAEAFRGSKTRFCVISFSSDWLYPTSESRMVVHALNSVAASVSFAEIRSDKGHDSFLLDEPEFWRVLRGFLSGSADYFGLDEFSCKGEEG